MEEEDDWEEFQEWLEMQDCDQTTAMAYQAWDDLRDAESELEELRAAEQEELASTTSEFEEYLEGATAKKKVGKILSLHSSSEVVKNLSTTENNDTEVVQILSAHAGPRVAKPADLPSAYHDRTEQEK